MVIYNILRVETIIINCNKTNSFYYFHFKMYFLKIVDIGAYLLQKFGSIQEHFVQTFCNNSIKFSSS